MGRDTDFNPEEFGGYDPELMPPEDYKTNDPPTYKCTAPVICSRCGKNHGDCDVITNRLAESENEEGEDDEMINRPNRGQQQTQQTNNGGGRQQKRNGLPRLNVKDCTFNPQPATIIRARVDDDSWKPGHQIVNCRVKFKGQMFLWGVRDNNPNLEILCDAFGDDETQWANKEIELSVEEDDVTGNQNIRCAPSGAEPEQEEEPEPAETGRRTRKPRG